MNVFNNERAKLIIEELARKNNCEKEVKKELERISRVGLLEPLFVYAELIKKLKEESITLNVSGSIGYLLTAYLLGITEINPREYNLSYKLFDAFENLFTQFRISVDSSKYNQSITIVETKLKEMGYRYTFIGHQCIVEIIDKRVVWVSPSNSLQIIHKYEEQTNINSNIIPLGDNKAIEYMLEMSDGGFKNLSEMRFIKFVNKNDYIRRFRPDSFLEFARVYSLIFGNVRSKSDFPTDSLCDLDVNIEELYNRLTNTYCISSIDALRIIYDCYHRERYTEGDELVLATHEVPEYIFHNFNSMSGSLLKALQDTLMYYKYAYLKTRV